MLVKPAPILVLDRPPGSHWQRPAHFRTRGRAVDFGNDRLIAAANIAGGDGHVTYARRGKRFASVNAAFEGLDVAAGAKSVCRRR